MNVTKSSARQPIGMEASLWERMTSDAAARRLFILPATIVILALSIFPLIFSLAITFTNLRLLASGGTRFIGLANWARLFTDTNFHTVLRNTIVFVLGSVSIEYLLGLGLALLLNQRIRLLRFFRISLLLPMMMSPIAISFIIGKMLFSETFGPINDILFRLGLPQLRWSLDPLKSMLVLISIDAWQWTPFFILVLLAGLQAIPPELNEAARVDGASAWQVFRRITFPLLMPLSATAILIRSLEAFKVIDIVRVVTGGGPGNATETATLFAYDLGIKGGDIAYASTVAYAFMIMVIIFSLAFLAAARRAMPTRES
ncbi:MAG TPA: ABC transporter permease [Chloroflexi bacterium]|nr:ABC transporter permease [Chloroflexota bacterium]